MSRMRNYGSKPTFDRSLACKKRATDDMAILVHLVILKHACSLYCSASFVELKKCMKMLIRDMRYYTYVFIILNIAMVKCSTVETKESTFAQYSDESVDLNSTNMPYKSYAKCVDNQIHYADGTKGGTCYENAAITTEVDVCSEIGNQILLKGGNAVDAAIASTICVGIVNSFSSGIGGGGFLLLRKLQENGPDIVEMYDFRETAPRDVRLIDFENKKESSKVGGMAVCVPGEVAGLLMVHKTHGKLPWKDLFTENIKLANEFTVTDQLYKRLTKFENVIMEDPGFREIYVVDGQIAKVGTKISRKNYARTLETIANKPDDFYKGRIASQIVRTVQQKNGRLSRRDLAKYKCKKRDVLVSSFQDYTLYSTNLPTSGVFLIEALNILEHFDLRDIVKQSKLPSGKVIFPQVHLLIEVMKFMFAKRARMSDPDVLPSRERKRLKSLVDKIMDKDYAKEIAKKIDFEKVLETEEYGFEGMPHDDHGTTHLNVIDQDEMAVLVTSTVNLEFGAKFMCPETGIVFNNEMDDFYVPKIKNAFDLAVMESNIVKPLKRPFSSAAPFLLISNEEMIALGAAGGTRIPTSLVVIIYNLLLGKTMTEAVKEQRLHNQFYPLKTFVENGFQAEIKSYLEGLGHVIEESALNSVFTSVQGIHMFKQGDSKILEAVSDDRKGGKPAGH